jgi:transposase
MKPVRANASFGLDLHKKYATVCGISQQGDVVLKEDRLPLDQLSTWAADTLTSDDAVALEATANSWRAYDCLAAHAGQVPVVNPIETPLIAQGRINADELSAEALARLLRSNLLSHRGQLNPALGWGFGHEITSQVLIAPRP